MQQKKLFYPKKQSLDSGKSEKSHSFAVHPGNKAG